MTAKSAYLSQLSFPIQPVSNVHWRVHLGLAGLNSLLVNTWIIVMLPEWREERI